jgi:hypothetical protein
MEWSMIIETKSARSSLQIGGEQPIAKTVGIHDLDGFSGVAGEGADGADVSLANNAYVITGTVEVSDPEIPDKTRTVALRLETPAKGDSSAIKRTGAGHAARLGCGA